MEFDFQPLTDEKDKFDFQPVSSAPVTQQQPEQVSTSPAPVTPETYGAQFEPPEESYYRLPESRKKEINEWFHAPLVPRQIVDSTLFSPATPIGQARLLHQAVEKYLPNPVSEANLGLSDSMVDLGQSVTSPQNLALLPLGGVGKVGQVALGAAFEAQQILQDIKNPEQFKAVKDAYDRGDYREAIRMGTGLAAGHGLPALAPLHAAMGKTSPVESRARPEPPVQLAETKQAPTIRPPESSQPTVAESSEISTSTPQPETKPVPQTGQPQKGFVRLYHGSVEGVEKAGSDFTTSRQYAEDYAAKSNGGEGGQVWYVDVPEGTLKTHDEYGQPMTRIVVPDEIADQAKPVRANAETLTPPEPVTRQGPATTAPQESYPEVTVPSLPRGEGAGIVRNDAFRLQDAIKKSDQKTITEIYDKYKSFTAKEQPTIVDQSKAKLADVAERALIDGGLPKPLTSEVRPTSDLSPQFVPGHQRNLRQNVETVPLPDAATKDTRTTQFSPQEEISRLPEQQSESRVPQSESIPTEPQVTSTKNAVTAAEREARGIEPVVEEAKRDFGTVWDEAAKADPEAPRRLVESLVENPRSVTDHENALLLRRQIELQNEYDTATKAVEAATDDVSRMDASARLERVRDDLQTIYDVDKSAGRETARGLSARRMLAANDFSLQRMEATMRAVANEGKPLNEKQAAEIKGLHERIKRAETRLEEYQDKERFNQLIETAKKEARENLKAGRSLQQFLDEKAQGARQRLREKAGRFNVGVDPTILSDYAIIGASHIARGATKFAVWSGEMVREFGDAIKPHLQTIWEKARELHNAPRSKLTPEERSERNFAGQKKAIVTRTEKLKERTEAGDFEPKPKPEPRMDKEKARLMFDYQKAREDFNRSLFNYKLANQTTGQKAVRYGGEAINTTRALMTSFDLSAVLRQGGILSISHPVMAVKAFPAMLRALTSERAQFRIHEEIRNRPNAPLYKASKLFLVDERANSLSAMEEAYMSRLAGKIPGVGASQRAYVTFLNRLRADAFDKMAAGLGRNGKVTLDEAKALSNYVNVATGRGDLGKFGNAGVALNTVFFAPRLALSRFQYLLGQPFLRGSGRTRVLLAKEYGRFLAGAATVYALGQSAGGQVETDPRSSDFGKLRFGNSRIDPMSGLIQATVFMSRLVSGKQKNLQGKLKPSEPGDLIWNYAQSKAAPAAGAALDAGRILTGNRPFPGHPQNLTQLGLNLTVPISFTDIYKAIESEGVPRGMALGILSEFGASLQTYAPETLKKPGKKPNLFDVMRERRFNETAEYFR